MSILGRQAGPDRRQGGLRADESGAAAVEFALVALPFLLLLFAILQTSLVLFVGQILQTQVTDASRKLMTGQFVGKSESDFRTELCSGTAGLIKCDKLYFQVQGFADAAALRPSTCFNPDRTGGTSCFAPGGPQNVVVVRAVYPWPFGISLNELGRPHNLTAISVFRSEPF